MPYKKPRNSFFTFFSSGKKNCDDILTIADKVIEDYIYSKSRAIKKTCFGKKSAFFIGALCIAAVCALLVYII